MRRRQILALQIEIRAPGDACSDEPAEGHSEQSAAETHDACLHEKQLLYVTVGRPQSLEDSDFAPTLEDGHHERVDDAQRGNGKRQAAENPQEKIENGEKQT